MSRRMFFVYNINNFYRDIKKYKTRKKHRFISIQDSSSCPWDAKLQCSGVFTVVFTVDPSLQRFLEVVAGLNDIYFGK